MKYESFDVAVDKGIATVNLNNPEKLNSMIRSFWDEFPLALEEIGKSSKARVIVLKGEGKHFCAGIDLESFASFADHSRNTDFEPGRLNENLRQTVLQMQHAFSCLEKVRQPVLCAIQGACVGAALDMVSAADMRYCTRDAFFQIAEINQGLTADLGSLQRLPKMIPQGVVRELAYTGDRLPPERAESLGLVNQVFDDYKEMLAHVYSVAERIAGHSPLAITGCKEMMNFSRDRTVEDGLAHMALWQSGMFKPNDLIETIRARMEDRPRNFEDLYPITKAGDF